MSRKVALVTGASAGIGELTARKLHEAGFVVYGAARRVDRMADLAAAGVHTVALDVTDEASATGAVAAVVAAEGRIDVLVNNAGYGSYGALEDVPLAEARAQFDVNVFGLAQLTQLVLPVMREQRSGTIVNLSSMGGRFATPLGAWYHASKYAVEGLSDAMRLELKQFGIDVVLIEPGLIRTDWGTIAAGKLRATSARGAYADQAAKVAKTLEDGAKPNAPRTSPPEVIAEAIVQAAAARNPKTRYKVGYGARPLILLSKTLPDKTFDRLIKRATNLT